MKKADIAIGTTYTAKVSDKVVPVRIDAEHASGGWNATNLATGKTIRIKSAQRLRGVYEGDENEGGQEATGGRTTPRAATGKKGAGTASKRGKGATRATERAHGDVPDKTDAEPKKPKPTKPTPDTPTRISLLDAAAQVLAKATEPMASKEIVVGAMALGWTTNGKTPHATLYAAMTREIATKGDDARFVKVERGRFAFNG